LPAVGRAHGAGLAQRNLVGAEDLVREGPRQPAVAREGLVEDHGGRSAAGLGEEPAVVVEHGHVVARAGAEFHDAAHGDDPAPIAHRLELGPAQAVVLGEGHAARVEAAEHDDPFLAGRVDHAVQRGHLQRGGPARRGGQALAPGAAAVRAPLGDDRPPAVTLGIDAEHGLAVFEEDRGGVAQILARLPVDHHLALRLVIQVDQGNGEGRLLVLGARRRCARQDCHQARGGRRGGQRNHCRFHAISFRRTTWTSGQWPVIRGRPGRAYSPRLHPLVAAADRAIASSSTL